MFQICAHMARVSGLKVEITLEFSFCEGAFTICRCSFLIQPSSNNGLKCMDYKHKRTAVTASDSRLTHT